jgi:hypothetical protein
MEKSSPISKVMLYQSVGFIALISLTFLDELLALPSLIFGAHSFISDFRETSLKMLLILTVWFVVAGSTRRILARVRYLERFMRICAWCHHIDFKGQWVSLEDFLQAGFDTPTTHGICPICLAKQQAAILKAKQERAAAAAAASPEPKTPASPSPKA